MHSKSVRPKVDSDPHFTCTGYLRILTLRRIDSETRSQYLNLILIDRFGYSSIDEYRRDRVDFPQFRCIEIIRYSSRLTVDGWGEAWSWGGVGGDRLHSTVVVSSLDGMLNDPQGRRQSAPR